MSFRAKLIRVHERINAVEGPAVRRLSAPVFHAADSRQKKAGPPGADGLEKPIHRLGRYDSGLKRT
jgi:hypothetical protein